MPVNSKLVLSALSCLAGMLILGLSSLAHAQSCEKPWPAWETFKKSSITDDGRVEDQSADGARTTSEGQSYALFFSLVAGDRPTFEKLLSWTEKNLSEDDLITHLPSWELGKKEDDSVGVLDTNSASDSDLWTAYALGEAGRLWEDRRYVALSSLIANRILSAETLTVPNLGLVLLPGAAGFTPTPTSVRLNPSYVPLQLMHWFTAHSKDPRWAELLNSSRQLIVKSSPKGYAPDWTIYDYNKGFLPDTDPEKGGTGSYDAIRVYLWAGMLSRDDADRSVLMDALKPMARLVDKLGYPPESVQIMTGDTNNQGSSGFSAAMVPFLQSEGLNKAADAQLGRIEAQPISEDSYYDQVLGLFALGWQNNLYRFDSKGNLTPSWKSTCK
ncbi:MAG: cellulose synthase complex periplasmic endoglucanase BcsZ [Proteobacteria bacterium]|nr:cellulose synthase complex periplasmic endoglucanase BcsZ [Pseudomonadota bacterium]